MYTSIRPGKKWKDTNGKPIQAHGFSIFYKDGTYYWYGENKEHTRRFGKVWHWGVRLYVSKDFYNWEDKGLIIPPQPDNLQSPLHPTYCMDRPHIIYCEKTGKYVAWLKIMGRKGQFFTILTADQFEGPYVIVKKIYNPLQMESGDFALYFDSETGKGYVWYERPHFQLICAMLTDDLTGVEEEFSVHYNGLKPPFTREAPTFFMRDRKKYLFTSGTSGYFPNESRVCVFDDYHGEYTDLGNPHIGDKTNTSFSSQITSVIKIPGKDLYVACADRWVPGRLSPKFSKLTQKIMKRIFKNYEPDLSPCVGTLSGKKQTCFDNTCKSRYVFLPIEWEGDKPVIRWKKEWRLEDYR